MDMTMKIRQKVVEFTVLLYVLIVNSAYAEERVAPVDDQQFTPYIGLDFTYSDNIERTDVDTTDSFITDLRFGIIKSYIGNDSNLFLDYELNQLIYSHDSDANELYHDLWFYVDNGFDNTGITLDASISVDNFAKSLDEDANADIYSGETIENRYAEIGARFNSNPKSYIDIDMRFFGIWNRNEDDIGNFDGYGFNLDFKNGLSQKDIIWSIVGLYDNKRAVDSNSIDTERSYAKGYIGYKVTDRWAPLIRGYVEEYDDEIETNEIEYNSVGFGTRYYFSKIDYFEFSYNIASDDNSNYFGAMFHYEPSSRFMVNFEYDNRYFGDTYDLVITHKSRRLTNSIIYSEDIDNFNREFYTTDENLELFRIYKELEWLSKVELKRTTYGLSVFYYDKEPLSHDHLFDDESGYGAEFSVIHNLTRLSKLYMSASYNNYDLYNISREKQDDEYYVFTLSTEHRLSRYITALLMYEYNGRVSNTNNRDYSENRISLDMKVEW